MTKLVILSSTERARFDATPILNGDERALYFSLTNKELKLTQTLRSDSNKVGFVLQLGYFKANGKFFTAEQFRRHDISYVTNLLGISSSTINLSSYQKKIPSDHRKRILALLGWQPFDSSQQAKVTDYIQWLVQRQLVPKQVFLSMIDFCWQNNIELPSYNTLAVSITLAYNEFEQGLVNIIATKLTQTHREKLDHLVNTDIKSTKRLPRSNITLIKHINQSLQPSDIQENVDAFTRFKDYFNELKPLILELQLSDTATGYFAT